MAFTYNNSGAATANAAEFTRIFTETSDKIAVINPGQGRLFVDRPFRTLPVWGCGNIICDGGQTYNAGGHPDFTFGMGCIYQIGTGPIGIISGVGFRSDQMAYYGDSNNAIFEVEGRTGPVPCGMHRFEACCFHNATAAMRLLAGNYDGYVDTPYDPTKLVADENHADNSQLTDCTFMDIDYAIHSENQQAQNWLLRNPLFAQTDKSTPAYAYYIDRGGYYVMDTPRINLNKFSLFSARDYSPNQSFLICNNFVRDGGGDSDGYLTLFEYRGDTSDLPNTKFVLRISGYIPSQATVFEDYQISKLLVVPARIPRLKRDWEIKVWGLPNGKVFTG